MRRYSLLFATLLCGPLAAQNAPQPPAAIDAIRESEIRRDLAVLAGDDMRGREAGTLDEMRASMWVAEEMRRIGLEPLGDFGSWFQWWNMRRTRLSSTSSSVQLGGSPLALWTEIAPTTNAAVDLSAPTVFVASIADTTLDVRGKVAVVGLVAPASAAIRATTNTWEYNYTRAALTATSGALIRRGAVGVVVVADSVADIAFHGIGTVQSRGTYDVIGGVPRFSRNPGRAGAAGRGPGAGAAPVPVLLVRRSSSDAPRSIAFAPAGKRWTSGCAPRASSTPRPTSSA
jgi:hypothetical protein